MRRGAAAAVLALAAVVAAGGARAVAAAPRQEPQEPRATLLYQNFPNPFPTPTSDRSCIWLDLRRAGRVRLEILDVRGRLVRTLVPSADVQETLPAGRYGRGAGGTPPGCDPRFTWDGTARDGRAAPAGIYLLRMTADGTTQTRKIVFRGR
jgi:hypothetical protein